MSHSAQKLPPSGPMIPAGELNKTFIPDFCHARAIFLTLLIGELMALTMTLATSQSFADFWTQLGFYSLFILWVTMASAVLLCLLRPRLIGLSIRQQTIAALFMVALIIVSASIFGLIFVVAGELDLSDDGQLFFIARNFFIGLILAAIALRYFYLSAQYRWQVQSEAEARVQALQARIHPHFLFNSLNSIASLTQSDAELAEEMILDLAELFRASLQRQDKLVTYSTEKQLCEQYLRLEGIRLGERMQWHWMDAEIDSEAMLPPLSLQPLLENAVYHGLQAIAEGGTITICAKSDGDSHIITITNPLPENTSKPTNPAAGNRMAVRNIQERLAVLYGKGASLELDLDEQKCVATVTLPREMAGDLL